MVRKHVDKSIPECFEQQQLKAEYYKIGFKRIQNSTNLCCVFKIEFSREILPSPQVTLLSMLLYNQKSYFFIVIDLQSFIWDIDSIYSILVYAVLKIDPSVFYNLLFIFSNWLHGSQLL